MSHSLPAVAEALDIDWKVFGAAIGVGIATVITTVWGWLQGQKKAKEKVEQNPLAIAGSPFQVAGATLQDNMSLRENTQATQALRDQIILLIHAIERHNRSNDEVVDELQEVKDYLRKLRVAP